MHPKTKRRKKKRGRLTGGGWLNGWGACGKGNERAMGASFFMREREGERWVGRRSKEAGGKMEAIFFGRVLGRRAAGRGGPQDLWLSSLTRGLSGKEKKRGVETFWSTDTGKRSEELKWGEDWTGSRERLARGGKKRGLVAVRAVTDATKADEELETKKLV